MKDENVVGVVVVVVVVDVWVWFWFFSGFGCFPLLPFLKKKIL